MFIWCIDVFQNKPRQPHTLPSRSNQFGSWTYDGNQVRFISIRVGACSTLFNFRCRLTWSTRISWTIRATWLRLESTCGSTIRRWSGTFWACPPNGTRSIILAVPNRIRISSSTSRSVERRSSTPSTWLFLASEFLTCQSWYFICRLIRGKKLRSASAFCCRRRCSFCWYLKLFHRRHWRFRCWANICCSRWYWSGCRSLSR